MEMDLLFRNPAPPASALRLGGMARYEITLSKQLNTKHRQSDKHNSTGSTRIGLVVGRGLGEVGGGWRWGTGGGGRGPVARHSDTVQNNTLIYTLLYYGTVYLCPDFL